MRRAIFAGFDPHMGANQDEGGVGPRNDGLAGLIADGVQPGGDVSEGCDESPIGGSDPQMAPVGGKTGQDAAHGVLADSAGCKHP